MVSDRPHLFVYSGMSKYRICVHPILTDQHYHHSWYLCLQTFLLMLIMLQVFLCLHPPFANRMCRFKMALIHNLVTYYTADRSWTYHFFFAIIFGSRFGISHYKHAILIIKFILQLLEHHSSVSYCLRERVAWELTLPLQTLSSSMTLTGIHTTTFRYADII